MPNGGKWKRAAAAQRRPQKMSKEIGGETRSRRSVRRIGRACPANRRSDLRARRSKRRQPKNSREICFCKFRICRTAMRRLERTRAPIRWCAAGEKNRNLMRNDSGSRRAGNEVATFRSGAGGETERQRVHLFHRRGREAGARVD